MSVDVGQVRVEVVSRSTPQWASRSVRWSIDGGTSVFVQALAFEQAVTIAAGSMYSCSEGDKLKKEVGLESGRALEMCVANLTR